MEKEQEKQLITHLQKRVSTISSLEGIKSIKLGPSWDYNIINNNQIEAAGYFQLVLTNDEIHTFCTYTIDGEEINLREFTMCTLVNSINDLVELAEKEYPEMDQTGEIIFWPYNGYWMKIKETNDFWQLLPGEEPKKFSEKDFLAQL